MRFLSFSLLFTGIHLFFIDCTNANAQYFEKVYGADSHANGVYLATSNDHGAVILANAFDTSFQSFGYYIIKTDSDGIVEWQKSYANPFNSYSTSISVLNNGHIIFLGTQTGVSFQNVAEVVELDSAGNILNNEIYPPFNGWGTSGIALSNSSDSSVSITIYNDGFISNNYYSIFSLNPDFSTKWSDFVSFDGSFHTAPALTTTPGFDVYTLAYYENYFYSVDAKFKVTSLKKHNNAGINLLDSLYEFNCPTIAVSSTKDGGAVICGTQDSTMNQDMAIFRLDSIGNVIWQKQYGSIYNEESNAIIETADSGFVLLATMADPVLPGQHNIIILKTNANGDSLWSRQFGGIFNEKGLQVKEDGTDLLILSTTTSFGNDHIYLIRTDSSGIIQSPYNILSNGTYFCTGDTAAFQLIPAPGPGMQITWSNGDTLNPANITSTGTYYATLTDSVGNSYRTPSVPVYFSEYPNAWFAPDTISFCEGTLFIDSSSIELTNTFQWYLNGAAIPNENLPFITPRQTGVYQLVVSNYCLSDTGTSFLDTLFMLPAKPVITSPFVEYVCPGDSLPISITPVSGNSYQWYSTDNISHVDIIPGATDTLYYVLDYGNFLVSTIDVNGCSIFSTSYTVAFDHSTEFVYPNGPTHFCQGGEIQLSVSDGTDYNWSTGDTTRIITIKSSGDYYVSFTNIYGCSKNSDTLNITVLSNPTLELGNDTNLCSDSTLLLDAGPGFSNYFWNDATTGQTLLASSLGSYPDTADFFVAITDSNGCTNSDTLRIIFDICIGVEENISPESLKIYPNPLEQGKSLSIVNSAGHPFVLIITDQLNREISRNKLNNFVNTIETGKMKSGIYIYQIQNAGKTVIIGKFIIN